MKGDVWCATLEGLSFWWNGRFQGEAPKVEVGEAERCTATLAAYQRILVALAINELTTHPHVRVSMYEIVITVQRDPESQIRDGAQGG